MVTSRTVTTAGEPIIRQQQRKPRRRCYRLCQQQQPKVVFGLLLLLLLLFSPSWWIHTNSTAQAHLNDPPQNDDAFLLLCLTDGSIYSLSAWTGEFQAHIQTDPLLQSNHPPPKSTPNNNNDDDVMVVPGLDGRLYWKPSSNTAADELQELPLTVAALLEHPVRSCDPDSQHPETCGILTAEAVTSLLALSPQGDLLWKTTSSSSSHSSNNNRGESESSSSEQPNLLLQRKDFWIQHILASSGQQSWNVSMGSYQALDFGGWTSDGDEGEYDLLAEGSSSLPRMPSIFFSHHGKRLTAVDTVTEHILWRQTTPSTMSAVFGICQGQWRTIDVLPEPVAAAQDASFDIPTKDNPLLPERIEQETPSNPNDLLESFLWQQHVKHRQEQSQKLEQKALPSREQQEYEQQQEPPRCYWNMGERICPNLQKQLLRLPSGPPVVVVQQEGILLTWSTVLILLTIVLALLVALFVAWRKGYILNHKKTTSTDRDASSSSSSRPLLASSSLLEALQLGGGWAGITTGSNSSSSNKVKRSNSLPGTLGIPDPRLLPLNNYTKSDDGVVVSMQPPTPATSTAAIPHYSRYASEFEELHALGKGGFGSVFQCRNNLDGRDYAIKKVWIRAHSDTTYEQELQRVLREVKILAVLVDHPNIVRYYTAWMETAVTTEPGDGATERDDDDPSCYTSSMLVNSESVSEWNVRSTSRHQAWKPISKRKHYKNDDNNPLGWGQDQFLMGEESEDASSSSLFVPSPCQRGLPTRSSSHNGEDWMIFEDSKEEDERTGDSHDPRKDTADNAVSHGSESSSHSSSHDGADRGGRSNNVALSTNFSGNGTTTPASKPTTTMDTGKNNDKDTTRHILYIQMQLCSSKTVAEFLADSDSRRGGNTDGGVDIRKALRLFLQIAEAVQHVHSQGLIHRDLKPQNCFIMDDAGTTVKVGDFGLSRESSAEDDDGEDADASVALATRNAKPTICHAHHFDDGHTAGVGTRSYASPEQMSGSDYDSSTDVYSLGIMLFEMLYPMYTGMERTICLTRLRNEATFPSDWDDLVGQAFPTMKNWIRNMTSRNPASRPTAEAVAKHIQSLLLTDFTILDESHYNDQETVLLRVEAEHREDALFHTMKLIRDEFRGEDNDNPTVNIVQYGLRSASSSTIAPTTIANAATSSSSSADEGTAPAAIAIMEFALQTTSASSGVSNSHSLSESLVRNLVAHPEIYKVQRHISGGGDGRDA